MFHLRLLCIMALSGVALTVGVSTSSAAEPTDLSKDPWPGLVQDIFNNRPMSDGSNVI
jgi:sulfur-oxidizing protein SoxY